MRIRTLRIASQVVFFLIAWLGLAGVAMTGLIYPYFFCVAGPGAWAACPVKYLEIGFMGLEHSLLILAYLIGFFGLFTLVVGRAFCGWMCPIGFTQEVLYKLRRLVMPVLRLFKGPVEGLANSIGSMGPAPRYYKYGILILIPLASLATGKLVFTGIDPIGGLTATIPALLTGNEYTFGDLFWVKILLLVAFLLMSFAVMRAWCRFLCPLGALTSPMNKVSLLQVKREDDKCTKCNACISVCPMKIDVPTMDRDMECIMCGRCVSSCKFDALKLDILGKRVLREN